MGNSCTLLKKIIVLGSFLFLLSCSQDEMINVDLQKNTSKSFNEKMSANKLNVFKGPQVILGDGKVRSWISVSKETRMPIEIGIEMTPGALTGLPDAAPGSESPTILLPLHHKAKELTPFMHIGLNWQNHGHGGGPTNTEFASPHFDFHFYTISNEERLAIPNWCSCPADEAFNIFPQPVSDYMPSGYVTPPGQGAVYGQMGKHWLPIPFDYLPFTKVMVYGTYDGAIVFLEPMVALDYLLSKPDFHDYYRQPKYFAKAGNYPTKYNISYDDETGNTLITLSEFVPREATP